MKKLELLEKRLQLEKEINEQIEERIKKIKLIRHHLMRMRKEANPIRILKYRLEYIHFRLFSKRNCMSLLNRIKRINLIKT